MHKRRASRSWVMRLPPGLRDQPAWILIGTLFAMAGLSYLLGFADSNAITRVLGELWLRVWGGFEFVSGALLIVSTWMANRPLERLSLRFLSLGIVVYMGWALTAVPLSRASFTVAAGVCLVMLAEIRVGVIKAMLRPLPDYVREDSK